MEKYTATYSSLSFQSAGDIMVNNSTLNQTKPSKLHKSIHISVSGLEIIANLPLIRLCHHISRLYISFLRFLNFELCLTEIKKCIYVCVCARARVVCSLFIKIVWSVGI